jgi:hypothetical protein
MNFAMGYVVNQYNLRIKQIHILSVYQILEGILKFFSGFKYKLAFRISPIPSSTKLAKYILITLMTAIFRFVSLSVSQIL